MNPALGIWGWAQAVCFLACIAFSAMASEASGFFIIIYLMVAVGSVLSLLAFYLLFETLHALDLPPALSWPVTLLGVPLIVCFNSICFISVFDGGFHISSQHIWRDFRDLIGITCIPLAGALVGVFMNLKRISRYNHPRYTSDDILSDL